MFQQRERVLVLLVASESDDLAFMMLNIKMDIECVYLQLPIRVRRPFCQTGKGLRPATLLKKILCHRCFPVNFAKFLRTPFLQNTSGRLLLDIVLFVGFIYFAALKIPHHFFL